MALFFFKLFSLSQIYAFSVTVLNIKLAMNSPKTGACFSFGHFLQMKFLFLRESCMFGHIMIHIEDNHFHIDFNGKSKQFGVGYNAKTVDTTRHIIQTFIKKDFSNHCRQDRSLIS